VYVFLKHGVAYTAQQAVVRANPFTALMNLFKPTCLFSYLTSAPLHLADYTSL